MPEPSQKRPRGHGSQAALALERIKAGQGTQDVALGLDTCGAQGVQEVVGPVVEEYEPMGQGTQA